MDNLLTERAVLPSRSLLKRTVAGILTGCRESGCDEARHSSNGPVMNLNIFVLLRARSGDAYWVVIEEPWQRLEMKGDDGEGSLKWSGDSGKTIH